MPEGGVMKSFSPTQVVAWVSNSLLRWVGQRTILGFIVIEVLITIYLTYWIYIHKHVAFLGIFIYHWKTYLIFAGIRFAISIFGFYAVFIRRIYLTKIYYGLFFISAILAVWTAIPVHLLECSCADFLQCAALETFQGDAKVLHNPHHPPDLAYFESKRKVPYREPPMEAEKAEVFKQSHLDHDRSTLISKTQVSFMQLGDEAEEAHQDETEAIAAHQGGRLVGKKRTGRQPSALVAESTAGRQVASKREVTPDDEEGLGAEDPTVYFNISDPNIVWIGREPPWCENVTLDTEQEQASTEEGLKKLKRRKTLYLEGDSKLGFLSSKLYICAVDTGCGGVSVEIKKKTLLEVCQHNLQLVPRNGHEVGKLANGEISQTAGENGVWLQRNQKMIRTLLEEHGSDKKTLYKYAFRNMRKDKGMRELRHLYRATCMCETGGGCNHFEDALGEPRSWCYVRWSRTQLCLEEGIQMYWDNNEKKAWSLELCEKASCGCSQLGMHPRRLTKNITEALLNKKNKLNYGNSCNKWNRDDTKPWCYTGWDTTCSDRYKEALEWESDDPQLKDIKSMDMQWTSHLPCDKDVQKNVIATTESSCEDSSRIAELLILLNILLFVPMMVIIFKFLSNRCGDEFQCEEQFAVVLSTDDEDSSDPESEKSQPKKGEGEDNDKPDAAGDKDAKGS